MPDSDSTTAAESLKNTTASQKTSYWANMISHYEKRNASLEQRQTELAERLRLMECAVPSLLMGAMVSMKRNTDPIAAFSSSPRTSERKSTYQYNATPEEKEVQNSRSNEPITGQRRVNGKAELNRLCKNKNFRP